MKPAIAGSLCQTCGVYAATPCPVCSSKNTAIANEALESVGTELAKIIPRLFRKKNCGCRSYEQKMNNWGIAGCVEHKQEIIDRLVSKSGFGELARPVAVRWVNRAIQNAIRNECGAPVKSDWFTVLTTAPRDNPTIYDTVRSLRSAGFEPTVFAEPGSLPTNCKTLSNDARMGVWRNWVSGCKAAIESGSEFILTVQDDIVVHQESMLAAHLAFQETRQGFVSLYTPRHYSVNRKTGKQKLPGVVRIYTKSLWGACAICWRREELMRVIDHKRVQTWKGAPARTKSIRDKIYKMRKENPELIANSDTAIGIIMNDLRLPMWFLNPSAARHIATHSAIGHGGNSGNRNCGNCADEKRPLKEQIWP